MIDFQVVSDDQTSQPVLEVSLTGRTLLDCSLLNKSALLQTGSVGNLDYRGSYLRT